MDDKDSVPLEIQFTEFMGKVFDASKESNLVGYGLEITRVEQSLLSNLNNNEMEWIANFLQANCNHEQYTTRPPSKLAVQYIENLVKNGIEE